MHETKLGKFERLIVKIYMKEDLPASYLFHDNNREDEEWLQKEVAKGQGHSGKYLTFRDMNYVLNSMLKNKENNTGQQLYNIFIKEYPDSDQKVNVWKLWNGIEIVKGEKYIDTKNPWYKIIDSIIANTSYLVIIKCKACRQVIKAEVTSIPKNCLNC